MKYGLSCFFGLLMYQVPLLCLEGAPAIGQVSKVPSLKEMVLQKLVKESHPIPDKEIPEELRDLIKQKILGDQQEIDFLQILKQITVRATQVLHLQPLEFIVALSPDGKKLLAHHSENFSFRVYDVDSGKKLCEIPKHCDCIPQPLYSFSNDGNRLAFLTRCHKKNQDTLEIYQPEHDRVQTIGFTDFCAQAVAMSGDGSMLVCAGGCGVHLRMYRLSMSGNFVHTRNFGCGYIIAISPDNRKIASLSHDFLNVYDDQSGEVLFETYARDVPNLQFCAHDEKVFMAAEGFPPVRENRADEKRGKIFKFLVHEKTSLPSVAISCNGEKVISLVNGRVRLTYLLKTDGSQKFLELEKPAQDALHVVRLHDDDLVVTACTHHDVYTYDLEQLAQLESRFVKPLEKMAIDDVKAASRLLMMICEKNKKTLKQKKITQFSIDEEINKIVSPQISGEMTSTPGAQSLISKVQWPLFGLSAFVLALCVVRN